MMETNSKVPRLPRGRLSPWIEALIQSHGVQREEGDWRCLRAQVIGVGQMPASQAQDSDGPMGLLFLSDGAVQIPAVLTAAAWERLQENEDRENLSSLLNTTVCIMHARLLFHMAPEQTRCRFFLSVGELTTAAAGPVKEGTPCCTTLPTVRAAIGCAWRAELGQDQTMWNQSSSELSELLVEFRKDCLQEVMNDIRQRLVASRCPLSPQPSTSTCSAAPRTCHSTGWDLDRIRYKEEAQFSVPMRYLMIPECRDEQSGSKVTEPQDSRSVEDPDRRVSGPLAAGRPGDVPDPPVKVPMTDSTNEVSPSKPWENCSPPRVANNSSSYPSTPMDTVPSTTIESNSDLRATMQTAAQPAMQTAPQPAMQTAAQPTMSSAAEPAMQTASSKGSGCLPPYQQQTPSSSSSMKRKHSEDSPEALTTLQEEDEVPRSPPSWLFSSQIVESDLESENIPTQTTSRRTPSMHSDGLPFSYSYRSTGQNLQDFSRFSVSGSVLQWAVKYLITPKQTAAHSGGLRRTGGSQGLQLT